MPPIEQLTFASPWVFGLLALPVLFVLWQLLRRRHIYPTLKLPSLTGVAGHSKPVRGFLKQYLWVLRSLGIMALVVALARPQTAFNEENIDSEGIDIVMALDVSGSMRAMDFQPNRLEAAKKKAVDFVEDRKDDRIGLVVFAGESFTQCPITTDHAVVKKLLGEVKTGLLEDGTAIGMGLATAVTRLKDSDAESKVVVLLTDGVNNTGLIEPLTAVEAAQEYKVRIYTIGVGTRGTAKVPAQSAFGEVFVDMEVEIDEELLKEIANRTGGKYFRAVNNRALEKVYEEINELEKSRIEVTRITRKTEEFPFFLILGLAFLVVEWLLRYLIVRNIP